ncbi:hypothetical protein [Streptomyces sp. NPDC059786]|uniref:hypothetical protein n=1 Tax=Streptomyces sp. NPDC059786 TaxID=3346946 RepID=UPI003658973B
MSTTEAYVADPEDQKSSKPASERFRFRLLARGEKANALAPLAVKSLLRCHPNVEIIVIDANDTPQLDHTMFGMAGAFELLHIVPEEDEVARAVGRGTRHHLFYWRHSPQLLSALPHTDRYDVHCDADIVFLRPLDLASLLGPLAKGRIAAAVDESTLEYYAKLGRLAATTAGGLLPAAGSGGPLLQAGMIFSNPRDDGGFYQEFWKLAVDAANAGCLTDLPWDDMCVVSALLGQGGSLWERLLPLGQEWNYITDTVKDPGIFGCAAHYGGHRAKAFVLGQADRLFPRQETDRAECPWGTATTIDPETGHARLTRGLWQIQDPLDERGNLGLPRDSLTVGLPFSLTWAIRNDAPDLVLRARISAGDAESAQENASAAFFVYVDGRLHQRLEPEDGHVEARVRLDQEETVTLLAVSSVEASTARVEVSVTAAAPSAAR